VSTMGICLALGIIVALLAALTLIPSILAVVGDRIFWPSTMKSFEEGGKSTKGWYAWCGRVGQRYFERSSRFSLKHAKAITVVAIIVTLPAAYVALTSETSYDMIGAMQNGDSGEGMDLIGEYADEGMLMPNYVVLEYSETLATVTYSDTLGSYVLTWSDTWEGVYGQLVQLTDTIVQNDGGESSNIGEITLPFMWSLSLQEAAQATGSTDPATILEWITDNSTTEVAQILAIALPTIENQMIQAYMAQGMSEEMATAYALAFLCSENASGIMDYYVNVSCGLVGGSYANSETGTGSVTYLKLSIPTNDAAMAPRSMESINAISSAVDAYVGENSDLVTASWITGTAAVMYEVSEVISGEFNNIEILVVVLIIILLFFVMKSYTIPFRSVLTILMSICWTLALTHLVFVDLLGGEVLWLVPLILLVICLGLGMDYDILLTTRIKENVRAKGMSNDEAIHQAVLHTGSVITICGLIMGGAFGTLMLSSMEMLQEFGFALCFAILVDALIVRTYIVPAVMHLLGDWNWKGPKFLQKREPAPVSEDGEQ
ncbi:MAG: MMPL family transporter, partial [Thermoplasmata archaeon]|nr:MMPL family transporter [Thermoplasmata archaeon]